MKRITILFLSILMVFACIGCSQDADKTAAADKQQKRFATIGTGGVTGVYYPAGGAISKMVNKKNDQYGVKVTVESTGGSVFNVNAILAGDLEFGMVQSDRQFQALNGIAEWEAAGKQEKLRAVFALHAEPVNCIGADDKDIDTIADLKGKKVNVGQPGSGNRGNALDTIAAFGMDWKTDLIAEGLKPAESAKMLQDNRIDAYFYTVGHPNGSFMEASAGTRKVHFVAIEGPGIDKMITEHPYYAKAYIPIKQYPNVTNTADVPTYGVKATLCSSADVPDDIVYAVTKEVFENLDEFKALHPAFSTLSRENMLEGLSAPIHPGALKYYKEVGLK